MFDIKIVNKEDGSVLVEEETDCIIGSFNINRDGKGSNACMGFMSCDTTAIITTICAACDSIKTVLDSLNPVNRIIVEMAVKELLKAGE